MRSCRCLNVLINTNKDCKKVQKETLNLSEEEKRQFFFKQELLLVNQLSEIKKAHCGLVRTRQVGSWIINDCLNCVAYTHAIHKDLGESFVLVCANLLDSEAIANIKASDHFSTIFNIVVNPTGLGLDLPTDSLNFYKSPSKEITETIKSFDRITRNYIREEYNAMQERIRNYQMQEMKRIEIIESKSHNEHELLLKVILHAMETDPSFTNTDDSQSPTKNLDYGSAAEIFDISARVGLSSAEPKRQKGLLGKRIKKRRSKNEDLQFFYEEGSASESLTDSSESVENLDDDRDERSKFLSKPNIDFSCEGEDETTENQTGGVSIAKQKKQLSVAKSLPININFSSQLAARLHATDDFDEKAPIGENVDIAASIKALAKSVHGDAVFGELPKPRFSTQI